MNNLTFEQRLEALEKAVLAIQRHHVLAQPPANWIEAVTGSMTDVDPEAFEEVLRLGREYRQSDRPPDDVAIKEERSE